MTLSYLDQKREGYKGVLKINPNTIDSVQWFQSAIDTINTAIIIILDSTNKFNRMSAIEPAQRKFVEELEALRKELEEHPNRKKALENESARKLMEALKEQEWKIQSDEQFLVWLNSQIIRPAQNKDLFLKNVISRLFRGRFDEDIMHGQYERQQRSGSVIAVLDLSYIMDCHMVLSYTDQGSAGLNIQILRLENKYLNWKEPIIPTIKFQEEYIKSKKQ